MKKLVLKKRFDLIDLIIYMAISIAVFILFIHTQIDAYNLAQDEPLAYATIRAKELTNSENGYGIFYYYNDSNEINEMVFGDLTYESILEERN
jgi:hypothetical protein